MPVALMSVTDKTGLVEFAQALVEMGWSLVASGGTANHLKTAGLAVTEVSQLTGAPEILGGRVKTLHPGVHGGILSRRTPEDRDQLAGSGWGDIDMVVVNLYAFEDTVNKPDVTLEEAIENIDIGGVALLRGAAKNFDHVLVVSQVGDYPEVLRQLPAAPREFRQHLALKAFALTSRYDQAIAAFLGSLEGPPSQLSRTLRYGENPHQQARLYGRKAGQGPLGAEVLGGKELSYNNLLDLDAAWRAVEGFKQPTAVVIKHVSPCGIASADQLEQAVRSAIDCDPISAFGGIIAANRSIDEKFVDQLGDLFLECLAAPDFTELARQALNRRKNLRLLKMGPLAAEAGEFRSVRGGLLWQERDTGEMDESQWRVATERQPGEAELECLRFAWQACQHVRSNAIVLARAGSTVGIGGGQPNRVDSLRIAIERAGERTRGAVLASDAFFPFADSVELAAAAGITAIIQPGGSVRDQESIDLANARGLAMVFTGRRHFRH